MADRYWKANCLSTPICFPKIADKIIDAFHSDEWDEVEKIENTCKSIFNDWSRQLRAGVIHCIYCEPVNRKNCIYIWTVSLKKKDTIQVTCFHKNENNDYIAESDEQLENYDELDRSIQYEAMYNII